MKIIDTPHNTTVRATALAAASVGTVIRYYNFSNSSKLPDKCLTLAEAQTLSGSGLQIGVVFQQAQNTVTDFSKAKGIAAGTRAYRYAHDSIGQSAASGIYFSVDFDANETEITSSIVPFFKGIQESFDRERNDGEYKFRIGAYGSGLVCTTLSQLRLIELTWLAMSRNFRGTEEAIAKGNFHLRQTAGNVMVGGLLVDINEANPLYADFGQFSIPTELATPSLSLAHPRYRVIARQGLRLRSGPGTEFDVIGHLALDQTVFVSTVKNGWARVDVEGDGFIDGFASECFLERTFP